MKARATTIPDALSPSWSVNETLQRHPSTIEAFNRLGIDACCGGAATLADAAADAGVGLSQLLTELEALVSESRTTDPGAA